METNRRAALPALAERLAYLMTNASMGRKPQDVSGWDRERKRDERKREREREKDGALYV